MTSETLTGRELGTVLAALRLWQRAGQPTDLMKIATDEGRLVPLDIDEIDELCERLNGGMVEPAPAL